MKQEVMQIPNGELEIRQRIRTVRGVQVMLDRDLAESSSWGLSPSDSPAFVNGLSPNLQNAK